MFSKLMRPRTLLLVILLIIVAALTYGFAAGMTVTAGTLGDGESGLLSDMAVTVAWQLNLTGDGNPATGPTAVLDFGSDVPNTVYARTADNTSTWSGWVSCTVGSPTVNDATCNFPDTLDLADIYNIEVAASE